MGKAEGRDENWHGHVTAVTVAPPYRRLKLAAKMMRSLEEISDRYTSRICRYENCIIALLQTRLLFCGSIRSCEQSCRNYYVSKSRIYRLSTHHRLLFGCHRWGCIWWVCVWDELDCFVADMRKALAKDKTKKSMIPLKHAVTCDDIDLRDWIIDDYIWSTIDCILRVYRLMSTMKIATNTLLFRYFLFEMLANDIESDISWTLNSNIIFDLIVYISLSQQYVDVVRSSTRRIVGDLQRRVTGCATSCPPLDTTTAVE